MNLIQILEGYNGCPGVSNIPYKLINIVSTIITVIKFGVPILLIIFGMLDLGKAVIASKEDEIKKGQQLFIKRVIAAILVFFVITIVQLMVSLVKSNDDVDIWKCVDIFIKGCPDENCK